ncbi:MAG TPA: hypothetical protein VN192_02065 [Flavobacterium sp.]|nr:hypothetical protein [Flavobacterium sp.]
MRDLIFLLITVIPGILMVITWGKYLGLYFRNGYKPDTKEQIYLSITLFFFIASLAIVGYVDLS